MRDVLMKCTKVMSEENAVTLEQLQKMAAERDELDGMGSAEDEDQLAEAPTVEPLDQKESPPEVGKKPEEPPSEEPVAEPKVDESPQSDLAKGPPDVESGSLKSEATDDRLSKSETRLNDSWKKLNAKKGEVEEMRQEVEELRRALNEKAKPKEFVDEDGSTAEDYEAAAESFKQEGEITLAKEAMKQADSVRAQGRENQIEKVDDTFKKEWGNNFDRAADSYPELRDTDSGFRNAVNGLLQERPVLATYSGGIIDAADIVAMKIDSEKSSELREQISNLTDENAGLKSKLSIGGSDPTGAPKGPTTFNDMSSKEQFAELQRRAAEVDADGGY